MAPLTPTVASRKEPLDAGWASYLHRVPQSVQKLIVFIFEHSGHFIEIAPF